MSKVTIEQLNELRGYDTTTGEEHKLIITEDEIEIIYQKELNENKGTSSEVELMHHEHFFKDAIRLAVEFLNNKTN